MTREQQVLADKDVHESYVDRPREYVNDAFIDGVYWADAHPQSPWISVKAAMPENDDYVLAAYTDYISREKRIGVAAYFEGKWYSADADVYINRDSIKYWMSLPPLPEAGKEGVV